VTTPIRSRAAPEAPTTGEQRLAPEASKVSQIPDPFEVRTVPLGTGKGAPKIELLRSHRYNHYAGGMIMCG
jgi:hypothetical protein